MTDRPYRTHRAFGLVDTVPKTGIRINVSTEHPAPVQNAQAGPCWEKGQVHYSRADLGRPGGLTSRDRCASASIC